ncbi:MAG: DinB family protein [Pyrinomonadaceae bacterium]
MSIIANEFLRELESEEKATRECLAEVPMDQPMYKPHAKSMELGYLAILTGDIPRWIQYIIEKNVVDFGTYPQNHPKTTDELLAMFDQNMDLARKALKSLEDKDLQKEFQLRRGDDVLMASPLGESVSQAINHMVHHRGQLSVYLKLLDKKIPSIYGPSADSGGF